MNELPRIEKFIYSTLIGDSVLSSLISNRVYGYKLPREAVFPLVQFNYLAGRDVQGMGTNRILSRPLYQIKAVGRDNLSSSLVQIANRIDEIFQQISAQLFEGLAISSRREQPVSYQEAGGESETSFRHIGGFFRFDASETGGNQTGTVNYPTSLNLQPFVFVQSTPAALWIVNHNLGYKPSVEIIDSNGDEVITDVKHISVNQVQISFVIPTAGEARCI
jgi:hypothetical protein